MADVPDWLVAVEMDHPLDHNTLWRAFGRLLGMRRVNTTTELSAADDSRGLDAGLAAKPLTIDATCYEPRNCRPCYHRVCRKVKRKPDNKCAERPGKWGKPVNASRSKALRRMPKLALEVAAASHRILGAHKSIGDGSNAPDFDDPLYRSLKRARVRTVVAAARYDPQKNHRIARLHMGVRSVMPARTGRPTQPPPTGRFRRLMKERFARKDEREGAD